MEVSILNGYKIKDKKAIRFYDTVDDMLNDDNLKEGMHVKTKGYYSVNDGGGAEYHIVSTESLTEYQEELENGLHATLIVKDYVTPEMFGAKGNGIDDDTNPFQKALNNSKKVIANKSYLLRDIIVNNGNEIEFSTTTVIYRDKTDNENDSGLFVAYGSIGNSNYKLVSESTELSNDITLDSVSDLNIGDTILIKNPSETGEDSNKALVTTIIGISSTTVTLANPLQWDYPIDSYINKITPITFKINGNGAKFDNMGLVGRGYFITCDYAKDFIVENINVENSPTGVIRVHYSINGIIENCTGKKPTSNSAPYGEYLGILYSTNINCYNITAIDYRRCIDYVGSTYCNTYNSKGFRSGFTTHGLLARFCNFINCEYHQLKETIDRTCVIGNLEYYYDKDISFIGCKFINGNRNIYIVNNDCTCNIKDCIFTNSKVAIYNNGLNVNISNTTFDKIVTLISNINTTSNNTVNIDNCTVEARGSSSTNLISSTDNLKTTNYINNSKFFGTSKTGRNLMDINNSSFSFDTNESVTLDEGSRVRNSYVARNFGARNNVKVFNTVFNAFTHYDTDNAQNVIIQGCLYSGSINVSNGNSNVIDNNISVENIR